MAKNTQAVYVDSDLHKKIKIAACKKGTTIKNFVENAIRRRYEKINL